MNIINLISKINNDNPGDFNVYYIWELRVYFVENINLFRFNYSRVAADRFLNWYETKGNAKERHIMENGCVFATLSRRAELLVRKSRSARRLCTWSSETLPCFSSRRFDPPLSPPNFTISTTRRRTVFFSFLKFVDLSSGRVPLTLSDPPLSRFLGIP